MDNDFSVDLDDIIATIRSHDVVIARFVTVHRRLLFDFRATSSEPPLVCAVDPLPSIEARYRHLRELRPGLGAPPRLVTVFWPRYVASLAGTAAWQAVRDRLITAGHPGAVARAEAALAELIALEREAQREAILGGRAFRTIWSASPSPR